MMAAESLSDIVGEWFLSSAPRLWVATGETVLPVRAASLAICWVVQQSYESDCTRGRGRSCDLCHTSPAFRLDWAHADATQAWVSAWGIATGATGARNAPTAQPCAPPRLSG